MKIEVLVIFFAILKGAYGDTELPACESPPIENCVLSDETVNATNGETVWKTIEILLHHQVAQNFISSGKNFQIFWSDDLLSNGPNIVNKMYARHYRGRWNITELITFNLDDNKWGKVVINVTVPDFRPEDQIYLKVVLHLADGNTLNSSPKNWFKYYKNDPTNTTTSPLPTPYITDRNTTGKEEGTESTDIQEDTEQDDVEEEEHNEDGNEEGKSLQISITAIIIVICIICIICIAVILLYVLVCCMCKKLNAMQSLQSSQYMLLSQIDTDGQQPQGSRPDTENLPMSAGVTQGTETQFDHLQNPTKKEVFDPLKGTGAWALEDTGTQTDPTKEPIRTESELLPPIGTGAWALENTGTQTDPTEEPIRTESELLPPIGTGAWALETTGTQTDPADELIRIDSELLQPEHADSEL